MAAASSASAELEETGKAIETPVIPDSVTGFSPLSEVSGNDNKPVAASDSTEGKSPATAGVLAFPVYSESINVNSNLQFLQFPILARE